MTLYDPEMRARAQKGYVDGELERIIADKLTTTHGDRDGQRSIVELIMWCAKLRAASDPEDISPAGHLIDVYRDVNAAAQSMNLPADEIDRYINTALETYINNGFGRTG